MGHVEFVVDRGAVLCGDGGFSFGVPSVSAVDIALLAGQLVSGWVVGFAGGYVLTKFRDSMNAL